MPSKTKSINENDIILVYVENEPSFFARAEKIYPDVKPNWWRVKLLILQIPVFVTTWILDNDQIRGAEFTMSGTPVRIEKVDTPPDPEMDNTSDEDKNEHHKTNNKSARILSFNNNRTTN